MSFKLLKNRIAKLEPKEKAEYFFGSLHINDPHLFHEADHHYLGSFKVYGHIKGLCCCFHSGQFDSYEEGMKLLINALKLYTIKPSKIFLLETKDNELDLKTVLQIDGDKMKDLYPQGLNEPTPDMISGSKEFNKMTDVEWLAFFEQVF